MTSSINYKMIKFFIISSNDTCLLTIEKTLKDTFGENNCEIVNAISCDDALRKLPFNMDCDNYIFDEEECNFFSILLEKTNYPGKKRISLADLSANEEISFVNINFSEKGGRYITIEKKLFLYTEESEYDLNNLLRFVFYPPNFYFSYGNGQDESLDLSKEILLEVEECINNIFPNILTKKDFTNFQKGDLHAQHQKELTTSPYNIIILSEEYFFSYHCMNEFSMILKSVNFSLEKFNNKTCLIFSNNIDNTLDPHEKIEKHSDFMESLRRYWLKELEKAFENYCKNFSDTYKDRVLVIMNVLSSCIKFIENDLHKILRGEKITLNNIRGHGYGELIREVNSKLEEGNINTFYKHLSLSQKNSLFLKETSQHDNYKKLLNSGTESN